eukprot:1181473-Prymnesium_polylepis.1
MSGIPPGDFCSNCCAGFVTGPVMNQVGGRMCARERHGAHNLATFKSHAGPCMRSPSPCFHSTINALNTKQNMPPHDTHALDTFSP